MSYLKHKPGSIEELMANEATKLNDNAYQDMFKKELDKAGKGIGSMSPKEKKDFFNKIDTKYKAKNEELSAAQKKLPPALQKAIAKKMSDKTEEDAYDKDDEKPAKPKPKKEDLNKEEVAIVYTDKKTRQVVSKKFKNDSEARKFIKQFDGAAGQINFKPSSMLNKEDLDAKELQTKKTDNYKSKNESWKQAWEAATHKMPDGTIMKGAKHKDETKDEANDVDNGDEKKDTKKKLHADSGSKLTKVETEPSVDYKN